MCTLPPNKFPRTLLPALVISCFMDAKWLQGVCFTRPEAPAVKIFIFKALPAIPLRGSPRYVISACICCVLMSGDVNVFQLERIPPPDWWGLRALLVSACSHNYILLFCHLPATHPIPGPPPTKRPHIGCRLGT